MMMLMGKTGPTAGCVLLNRKIVVAFVEMAAVDTTVIYVDVSRTQSDRRLGVCSVGII